MPAINPTSESGNLRAFIEAAGQSLAEAQSSLAGDAVANPGTLAIADAELEVKAAVSQAAGGKLALQTLSVDALKSGIDPGLISTVRIRYVAVAAEPQRNATPPKLSPEDVIRKVRARMEMARLEQTLGRLRMEPRFIADQRHWLVTITDERGRDFGVRVVPDAT